MQNCFEGIEHILIYSTKFFLVKNCFEITFIFYIYIYNFFIRYIEKFEGLKESQTIFFWAVTSNLTFVSLMRKYKLLNISVSLEPTARPTAKFCTQSSNSFSEYIPHPSGDHITDVRDIVPIFT